MTPELYGQSVAIEHILMYLTRHMLENQEDPVAIVAAMKAGVEGNDRLTEPTTKKAAMDFFDMTVGPALSNLGHPYETQLDS